MVSMDGICGVWKHTYTGVIQWSKIFLMFTNGARVDRGWWQWLTANTVVDCELVNAMAHLGRCR